MSKKFGRTIGIVAVLALFLSLSALVGGNQSAKAVVPVAKSLSELLGAAGDIVTNVVQFTQGIKLGETRETIVSKTIPAGANQVVLYTNNTGRDVFASNADMSVKTSETASSTFKFYIVSTTTSSVGAWADFGTVVLLKGSLINGFGVSTSSTATTTTSVLAAAKGIGNGGVLIPDGASLIAYLQQNIDVITGCRGAVGLCEAATSTRRGFNPVATVKLRFF